MWKRCQQGAVCPYASQSFLAAATSEGGPFGWAQSWLVFSCDRLCDSPVLWDGDLVEFHWAAGESRTGKLLFALERDQASSVLMLSLSLPPFRRQSQKWGGRVNSELTVEELICLVARLLRLLHTSHLDFELSVEPQSTKTTRAD